MMGYLNQVWIFGELWKYSAFRIKFGLDWRVMDELRELINYLFMSLVRKLQ